MVQALNVLITYKCGVLEVEPGKCPPKITF